MKDWAAWSENWGACPSPHRGGSSLQRKSPECRRSCSCGLQRRMQPSQAAPLLRGGASVQCPAKIWACRALADRAGRYRLSVCAAANLINGLWRLAMRRVVSLFLPYLPTERLRRKRGKPPPEDWSPLATTLTVNSRRMIVSPDAPALALGVLPGMTVAKARGLVPDLEVVDADQIWLAMRRVVSLFLPYLPTERLRRKRGKPPPEDWSPLATTLTVNSRRMIVSPDAPALALGVLPGMTVAKARGLVPDLEVVDADPEADREALRKLALWAGRRYSPHVAPDPPDGIWIDITGCEGLFGGEEPLAKDLYRRIRASGLTPH